MSVPHLLDRGSLLADRLPGLATVAVLDKQDMARTGARPKELGARIATFASPLLAPGAAAG